MFNIIQKNKENNETRSARVIINLFSSFTLLYRLLIRCQSIKDKSNALFDYGSSSFITSTITVKTEGKVLLKNQKLFLSQKPDKEDGNQLFNLTLNNNKFILNSFLSSESDTIPQENLNDPFNPWIVLCNQNTKKEKYQKYKLSKGDIIKIGKIKFLVKDISDISNQKPKCQIDNRVSMVVSKNIEGIPTCRICLGEQVNDNDPLICPCKCSGTTKFIHLLCLRKWMKSQIKKKTTSSDFYQIFSYERSQCELCKDDYPEFYRLNGKLFELLDFSPENTDSKYIVLEVLNFELKEGKIVYLITFDKENRIKIGRGEEASVPFQDLSISRFHSELIYVDNKVYISDLNSKFGTLILLQNKNLNLITTSTLNLQIGEHFISLRIKPNIKIFSCCSREKEEASEILEYQKYNEPKRLSYFGEIIKDSADDINSIKISTNTKRLDQSLSNKDSNLSNEIKEKKDNEFINIGAVSIQQSRFV